MRPFIVAATCLLMASATGQEFELVEPTGMIAARAEVGRGRLTVAERSGERLVFRRDRRYDTRRYLGYFNLPLNRALRFPRSGDGKMQTADLEDRQPQFRYTRRSVRPVADHIPDPPVDLRPPPGVTYPGFGYPGFGYPPAPGLNFPYPPLAYPDPVFTLPGYATLYPQSVLIDSKVHPAPSLSPATVKLLNGGRRTILVTIIDRENPNATRQVSIAPGRTKSFQFQRDAGGEVIETYRVVTLAGDTVERRRTRPLQPQVRYEVAVHEQVIQSVAIDRTGKSPQVIEDINTAGEGLGRFTLPAGDQLVSGTIDAHRAAVESGLAETVAPILAEEDEPASGLSPVERAILEAQQRAQR